MKRLEAQNILYNIVMKHMNCQCYHTDDDMAENMLKDVEDLLGMAPPRLPEDYCQAIMSVYYGGYSFNKWEDEVLKDTAVMEAYNRRRKND